MPSYHPIFSGLWNDEDLAGLTFECKGFFCYLCTNDHMRPSGIYRVSDAQLVAETELPLPSVQAHLEALQTRRRILRDSAWLFVRGYLKRQPKQERLLIGARNDVDNCSSVLILESFALKYPMYSRWSTDRLLTINRPINDMPSPILTPAPRIYNPSPAPTGPSPDGPPTTPDAVASENGHDPEQIRAQIVAEAKAIKLKYAVSQAREQTP